MKTMKISKTIKGNTMKINFITLLIFAILLNFAYANEPKISNATIISYENPLDALDKSRDDINKLIKEINIKLNKNSENVAKVTVDLKNLEAKINDAIELLKTLNSSMEVAINGIKRCNETKNNELLRIEDQREVQLKKYPHRKTKIEDNYNNLYLPNTEKEFDKCLDNHSAIVSILSLNKKDIEFALEEIDISGRNTADLDAKRKTLLREAKDFQKQKDALQGKLEISKVTS